jgi:hypothetical protein
MTILSEAADITSNDRQRYYGHPADNHGNTAALWTAYLQRRFGVELELAARDVCLLMVLLKVSRDANKVNRDNLVDICGYARNAEMIEERAAEQEAWTAVGEFENSPSRTPIVPTSLGQPVTARSGGSEPARLRTIEDYPITRKLIDEIKAENVAREKGHDVYTRRYGEHDDVGPF